MSFERPIYHKIEQKDHKSILDNARAIPLIGALKTFHEDGYRLDSSQVRFITSELVQLFKPMIKKTAEVFLNSHKFFLDKNGIKQKDLEQILRQSLPSLLLPVTFKKLEHMQGEDVVRFFIPIFHRKLIDGIFFPYSTEKRFDSAKSLSKLNPKGRYLGQHEPNIEDRNAAQAREGFEDADAIRKIKEMILTIPDPIDSFIFIAHNGLGTEIFQAWLSTHKNILRLWSVSDKPKRFSSIDTAAFANKVLENKLPDYFMDDGKDFREIGNELGITGRTARLREARVLQLLTAGLNPKDFKIQKEQENL